MTRETRRDLYAAAALGIGFFLVAVLSLSFAKGEGRVAAVWPANALLLVALLRAPAKGIWRRVVAAALANVAAGVLTAVGLPMTLFASLANVAEALGCLYLLNRFVGPDIDLTRPRHLALFGVAGLLISPLASGLAVAAFLNLIGYAPFMLSLSTWWPTHALGLVIFGPVLLIVTDGSVRRLIEPQMRRRTLAMTGVLSVGLIAVFCQARYPLLFVIPPILVLVTFQLGLAGAAWGILATAVFSITALLLGFGPTTLVGTDAVGQAHTLEFFLAFLVVATLPLASVLSVQRRLEMSLQDARDRAQTAAAKLAEAHAVAVLADRMAGLGYWLYRPKSRELEWSDEMYRIYGLDPQDGVPPLDRVLGCYHPDDRRTVQHYYARSLQTGEAYEQELRVVRGGDVRRVIAHTSCQLAGDGSIAALIGTIIDVTAMRRAEAALVESEARYRTLADAVPDMILKMTPDGVITFASMACLRYGYQPEMLVGRRTMSFLHPDDVATAMARNAAIASGADLDPQVRREQRVRTATGAWVWLEGNPTQIRDAEGQVVEIVNAFRDVSRRRALEDELNAARLLAERSSRAKADFLSNMSHELRTPLTAIIGFAGLLRGTGKLGEREAMFADRIERSSRTLLSLVNDILDFSKIEAGGVTPEALPVDLARVVDESLAMVAGQAEAKGLALVSGGAEAEATFVGDASRLRQVLVNLLSNAVKFTDRGEVRLIVTRDDAAALTFEICDTGIGIPADRMTQIFERFTQADGSTTRLHGGTGLGLAICRGLVDAMGGTLIARSAPGEGSTFAFTLPVPSVPVAPAAQSAA